MQGNEYQKLAWETAKPYYKEKAGGESFQRQQLETLILALCGEAGELANKLKKMMENGEAFDYLVLEDELGDVLWYVATAAFKMGINLEDLMGHNISKLRARYGRNLPQQQGF